MFPETWTSFRLNDGWLCAIRAAHVNIVKYNNQLYDFRPFLKECYDIEKLNNVHINNQKYDIFTEFKKDVQTWYHNKFYEYLLKFR